MTESNITNKDSSQSSNPKSKTFYKYESGTEYGGAEKFITEEFKKVNSLRNHHEKNKDFTGLALSGGGIRSATFSLGVLQALAEKKWLEKIDYLSTVSGGGFIGSCMTWILSKGYDCSPDNFPFLTQAQSNNDLTRKGILHFLRQHGNYLAPGNGITLTSFLAALFRGTLISLIIFIPLAAIALHWINSLSEKYTTKISLVEKLFPFPENLSAPFEIAIALIFFFLFMAVVFALGTFASFLFRWKLYGARRLYEICIRPALWGIAIFIILGCIPIIHSLLVQSVDFKNLPSVLSGLGSILVGALPFISQFIKSSKNEQTKGTGSISGILGAGLLLFGFTLLAYHIAHSNAINQSWFKYWLWGAAILGIVTNINFISIHRYYRDRLMESYMPDIQKIKDGKWSNNQPAAEADQAALSDVIKKGFKGPYHIVNTNIITTNSTIPKFKGRGGDNFILSPFFCGSNATGWSTTTSFMNNSMTLASAMAISGAAVNPDTGVGGEGPTRNPLVSLVMRILNIRLGYWVPNPNTPAVSRLFPPNFFFPYLFSKHKESNLFLELSDGGHFENLGLYELFRRRMKTIIICDGGADKNFTFEDLGNALEKARVDLGVEVTKLDLEPLIPKFKESTDGKGPRQLEKPADQGYAVGDITYKDKEGKPSSGKLIYLKTTFIKKLPKDIVAYQNKHPDFPDQSTADQFFDERQFEAYRELGYQIAKKMISDILLSGNKTPKPEDKEMDNNTQATDDKTSPPEVVKMVPKKAKTSSEPKD